MTPSETLADASRKMALKEIGRLPVVDEEGLQKVIGIITRSDIINAYNRHVLQDRVTRRLRFPLDGQVLSSLAGIVVLGIGQAERSRGDYLKNHLF